jgi:hypothetical protein
MSRILCQSSCQVKKTRKSPHRASRFGSGLIASHPHVSTDYTAEDALETAQFRAQFDSTPTTGDLFNAILDKGFEVEDGSVSEHGMTIIVDGRWVRMTLTPILPPIKGGSGPTDQDVDEMYDQARWLSHVEAMRRHQEDELI